MALSIMGFEKKNKNMLKLGKSQELLALSIMAFNAEK